MVIIISAQNDLNTIFPRNSGLNDKFIEHAE